jgi:hypothetical protein
MNFLSEGAIEVIDRMGWNEDSVLCHLSGFLRARSLTGDWEAYLEEIAAEEEGENGAADE